jgi:hypothetical protein
MAWLTGLWQKAKSVLEKHLWTFRIDSQWQVEGALSEVAPVCLDGLAFADWWFAAFLDVVRLQEGDDRGNGMTVGLHAKGWLPYTLHLQARVVESQLPHGFTIVTEGDLEGRAVWTLEQVGDQVRLHCEWTVKVHRPLLRILSFLAKPLLASNHRWVMAHGERCLQAEVDRRRLASEFDLMSTILLPARGAA